MSNSRGSNAKFNLERIVEKVSNNIKNEESENFYYKEVSNQEETPLIQNQVSIKVGDEGFKPQLSPPQYLSDQDGINACLSECGDNVIASDENNNKIADTKKFKKKMSSNAGIIENTSCGEKRSQDSHHATDDNIGRSRTSRRPKSRSSSRRRKSSSLSTQSSKGSKQKLERKGLETNLEEQRIKSIISQKGERKERPTQEQLSLGSRAGGVYIPPARLRAMQAEIKDKSSKEYQRLTWDALKKSLNGLINKINVSNIKLIIPELFGENLIRGRGLFARSTIIAQRQSPMFTPVYAATVAIVNTKLPEVGGLIISRLICNFRNAFRLL
ncbi:uncharacterized protein LOC135145608 [Zophobas morio]|uniref:uncharacterized protein LOC135145608 n=1 Tax=Zophobas morio TaxID=2755281 RepID=UPI003082C9FB